MKTAALFAVAGELAAYISESSPENITAMKTFGLKLGTAYQIYDDCLDIAGDEDRAGKTLGTDLRKGKFTLPVLLLLQKSSPAEREKINEMILHEDGSRHGELAEWLVRSGSMSAAIATGKKILDDATSALNSVSSNRYAQASVPSPRISDPSSTPSSRSGSRTGVYPQISADSRRLKILRSLLAKRPLPLSLKSV